MLATGSHRLSGKTDGDQTVLGGMTWEMQQSLLNLFVTPRMRVTDFPMEGASEKWWHGS